MGIRSSAKALIVKDGKLLVIHCQRGGKEYDTLPGGGQEFQESLEQTVVRECLEEAGLSVRVKNLAAVQEEITTDPRLCSRLRNTAMSTCGIFAVRSWTPRSGRPRITTWGRPESSGYRWTR